MSRAHMSPTEEPLQRPLVGFIDVVKKTRSTCVWFVEQDHISGQQSLVWDLTGTYYASLQKKHLSPLSVMVHNYYEQKRGGASKETLDLIYSQLHNKNQRTLLYGNFFGKYVNAGIDVVRTNLDELTHESPRLKDTDFCFVFPYGEGMPFEGLADVLKYLRQCLVCVDVDIPSQRQLKVLSDAENFSREHAEQHIQHMLTRGFLLEVVSTVWPNHSQEYYQSILDCIACWLCQKIDQTADVTSLTAKSLGELMLASDSIRGYLERHQARAKTLANQYQVWCRCKSLSTNVSKQVLLELAYSKADQYNAPFIKDKYFAQALVLEALAKHPAYGVLDTLIRREFESEPLNMVLYAAYKLALILFITKSSECHYDLENMDVDMVSQVVSGYWSDIGTMAEKIIIDVRSDYRNITHHSRHFEPINPELTWGDDPENSELTSIASTESQLGEISADRANMVRSCHPRLFGSHPLQLEINSHRSASCIVVR